MGLFDRFKRKKDPEPAPQGPALSPTADTAAVILLACLLGPVRSVGAIPVYRGSARLKETFRRTVEALQAGDPVIVFPDVDYTDRSGDMGEIYDGFLLIDRFWQRVSDTPLDFVPLRLDRKARRIAAGEAVRFDRTAPRQGETVRVREALLRGLNGEI